MTVAARISQADMERATMSAAKAVSASGLSARIIYRLEQREIEVIIGETEAVPAPGNPWDSDQP